MGSGNTNYELAILYGLFKVCYSGEKYIVYIYIYRSGRKFYLYHYFILFGLTYCTDLEHVND